MIIDAETLRDLLFAGAKNLEDNKDWINDLNVFPVPDGDTGTNMTLTVLSAVREVQGIGELTMETLAKAISSGSLRGARGNSGVIMSQLFRGFTKEMKEHEVLDKAALAAAMRRASETAYKAVMKPKEGTILTVAKGMADKAEEICEKDDSLETFFEEIIKFGDVTLEHTPELLPVLKQAGVVDSGGQGLMQFLKGAYAAFTGQEIPADFTGAAAPEKKQEAPESGAEITFGYCTEFIINVEKGYDEAEELRFKAYLESIGDCVVVVSDDDVVKVHVHTNDPGLAIQKGLSYGSLSKMKIDNMREEHEEKLIRDASKIAAKEAENDKTGEHKEYGFVVVAAGDGLAKIIKELGADEVIHGGQTMNPSTDDFVTAINKINADNIFVLPNNKNIILAAEQAVYLAEDKNIIVVPTTTVPQGITAMLSFDPEAAPEDNAANIKEAISFVKTGQVTYAVRDTNINGSEVHENDIMGIGDSSELLSIGHDINRVSREMVDAMADEDSSVISIYYGDTVTAEEAENLAADIGQAHPDCDIELQCGGQPVYYYIISVE